METGRKATILHVDADAFFASVEQLLEARYRGKPVIVGGAHRGVVASASYEARRFGIHSAMPIYQARQRCPQGIFVKGRYGHYTEFSRMIFEILRTYTPTVEVTSIDEGYLDLAGTTTLHKAAPSVIARRVLREVKSRTGLTLSGGLSTSKLVSKICTSLFKPERLSIILPGCERAFLAPMPLKVIPGVGPKTLEQFSRVGIERVEELAAMPFESVWELWGGHGMVLWEYAQGIDRSRVSADAYQRKSISEEKTFPFDIDRQALLEEEGRKMLKRLCFRLRKKNLYARTLTLKIRYKNFQTVTHRKTLPNASFYEQDFTESLIALLQHRALDQRVRLLGVGLSQLHPDQQLELFGSSQQRLARLQSSLDTLRARYGVEII